MAALDLKVCLLGSYVVFAEMSCQRGHDLGKPHVLGSRGLLGDTQTSLCPQPVCPLEFCSISSKLLKKLSGRPEAEGSGLCFSWMSWTVYVPTSVRAVEGTI